MSLEKTDGKINNFKDLRIWRQGMDLVQEIYAITKNFPPQEVYGLTAQMRRAAVSVPSNIAEGFRRKHSREYRQFLATALGSCGELETQVEIAKRLGYLPLDNAKALIDQIESICKMTQTLMKRLF